jgi:nitrogenase molybdenum-cofactor synthesis protein NifE
MEGLLKYLSPFSPDQSGAVSVLYELGGLLVIIDAGGCAGNVCGFDEPRWFSGRSAVFSAGLRDMDAILGRDSRMMDKIGDALKAVEASFIGLIGTPVPSVIGTDFRALKRMAERRFGLPVIAVDTNGMETYERGQEKAYQALLQLLSEAEKDSSSAAAALFAGCTEEENETGILGATPLDLPTLQSPETLKERVERNGGGRSACYGFGSGFPAWKGASKVRRNLVVSPSGLSAAVKMKEDFGIPYECGMKLEPADVFGTAPVRGGSGNILIVHQQILAGNLREVLRDSGYTGRIDTASFFAASPELTGENDFYLKDEGEFAALLQNGDYGCLAGDPLFRRVPAGRRIDYVNLPHFAVSGSLYACGTEEEYFRDFREKLGG